METARSASGAKPFRFRHSDALLRSILENAAVGTFLIGPDLRLIYANNALYELLGRTAEEAIGIGVDEIVHPLDAAYAREQAQSLADGVSDRYTAERRYRRKDGSPVWVLVTAIALRDDKAGSRPHTVVQAVNIDRQKQAEAALAASESRWNFALESAGQGVWDHDLNAGTAFYSRVWRTMRGIGPHEVVDPSVAVWFARMHPDDRSRIAAILERQNSGEIPYNEFEYRERHRDGRWIWILSRGKPVAWNDDGTPSRFIGTDTDITSLKMAELQAALEKERFKVTLESIADGVISTDANGRVSYMNIAAEHMTGWTGVRAHGRPVADVFVLVDSATGEAVANPVSACLESGKLVALAVETQLAAQGGGFCEVHTHASPLRNPQGRTIGAVLAFQDVTDSRARQRELAHTAMHDSLTGLPNRAAFDQALVSAIQQARKEKREHALCFIDLDRFKAVNDTAGHIAGDALLRSIAVAIRSSCRAVDLAARIGGDEFALLLADCTREGALRVAQQVIDAIVAQSFAWEGKTYVIGASIGVTAITSREASPDELMREADAACYVAKANGRNQVMFYDGDTRGLEQIVRRA